MKNSEIKLKWKAAYTWVLVVNAVYIVFFYLLMKIFS